MKIGMPAVNRSLPELVYKRFATCPCYIIYDSVNNTFEYIDNFTKNINDSNGLIAAQILSDKKIDIAVTGNINENCLKLLKAYGIKVYSGFSGTCQEAIDKFQEKIFTANSIQYESSKKYRINSFKFIDTAHSFNGTNIQYIDWDFIRPLNACTDTPLNWQNPIKYGKGSYLLEVEIIDMPKVIEPIELEFGMFNYSIEKDQEKLERCSFGQYCRFTKKGKFMHLARISDMELTTLKGEERVWDWAHAWHAPFILIKPYGQTPYPLTLRVIVTIFESENR